MLANHFNRRTFLSLASSLTFISLAGNPLISSSAEANNSTARNSSNQTRYGYEAVDDINIFYREAGNPENPALVLLHGFPSSSHMYRNLINELSNDYYLLAPDYPGFGESSFPTPNDYEYTFDNIARTVSTFLEQRGVEKYSLYIQDYGAPVGMRIATAHPERVQSIITQNGNAYEQGINKETWAPILQYWNQKSPELEQTIIDNVYSLPAMKWQYTHGTRNPEGIAPENWNLDFMKISRSGQHQVQLALFYDYQNNVKLYPAWQQYLREKQPPVLVVWGKNDAFFPASGAEGFRKDVKDLDFNLLDTGHFALEEDGALIAEKIRNFLSARGIAASH